MADLAGIPSACRNLILALEGTMIPSQILLVERIRWGYNSRIVLCRHDAGRRDA